MIPPDFTQEDISFRVVGIPATQGSKTAIRTKHGKMVYLDSARKKLAPWRDDVRRAARQFAPKKPIEEAVILQCYFFLPVPKSLPKKKRLRHVKKPDLSKLVRAVEDSCKGIIWHDDSQVVEQIACKAYAYDTQPGVQIRISSLPRSC